jgi:hypothetical protein
MEFQAGQFHKFRVKTKVHLGALSIDLMEGTIIEFDGQTLKTGSKEYDLPTLQGGIKAGWLTLHQAGTSNISQYIPQPAGVKVRPAQSAGQERGAEMAVEAAVEDELVVGSLDQTNARRKAQAEAGAYQRPAQVRPTEDPNTVEASYDFTPKPQKTAAQMVEGQKNRPAPRLPVDAPDPEPPARPLMDGMKNRPMPRMPVVQEEDEGSVVSEQKPGKAAWERTGKKASKDADEVPVARLSSPASRRMKIEDSGDIMQAKREAEGTVPPPPKTTKKASTRRAMDVDDPEATPINAVHASGATGDVNETRTGDDLADLLPDAATSGKPRAGIVAEDAKGDARLQWDMTGHWQERVAKAVDLYGNDKNAIRQILEVESPAVAKQIRSKLARLGK